MTPSPIKWLQFSSPGTRANMRRIPLLAWLPSALTEMFNMPESSIRRIWSSSGLSLVRRHMFDTATTALLRAVLVEYAKASRAARPEHVLTWPSHKGRSVSRGPQAGRPRRSVLLGPYVALIRSGS